MDEYNLFNMKSVDQRKPYTVTLEVNEKPLVMEIDMGASYSVISRATHKRPRPQKQLLPTAVKPHTYAGTIGSKRERDGSSLLWRQRGKIVSFDVNR